MAKKHLVELTDAQRRELERVVNTGRESARKITRARILLKAAGGEASGAIAAALGVGVATVERVRRRFAEGGLGAAVGRRPQPPRPAKRVLDGEAEARLITLACSEAAGGVRALDAGTAGGSDGEAEGRAGGVGGHGGPVF